MYYVYILKSRIKNWTYVGYTGNLKQRIKSHNDGENIATKNYKPFDLTSFIAVDSKEKAILLERYFKTGSGIAWMKKRLINDD